MEAEQMADLPARPKPFIVDKFKSGQGDEAADSTDSTARRGTPYWLKLIHYIDCCTRRLPDRENRHTIRVHFSLRRQSLHGYFRLLALNAGQDV